MAKDKSGFMSAMLSDAEAPVAPNASLLEQAGAYRGKAAEIDGMRTAEAINFATSTGKAVYEGYVESEAANAARDVTEGLNAPEVGFVGPRAQVVGDMNATLEANRKASLQVGPPTSAAVVEWEERAKVVRDAAKDGVFSQAEAQARLATDMRRLIAENPSQAERIRKVYNSYTGRSDWDIRPIEQGLTGKAAENDMAKTRMRLMETEAKAVFEQGVGAQFGMRSLDEVFTNIAQGTEVGVRMSTAYQANRLTQEAGKMMTSRNMNEFYNGATVAAGAARASANQRVVQQLALQGINVLDMTSPTETQRPAIMEAYRDLKTTERSTLEGAIRDLEARVKANPSMDREQVDNTIERLQKRLKDTPLTADIDSILNELKMDATARNMKADTILKTNQIREISLKTTWSDDMLTRMKDPRTRAQLVSDYPNNPFVKELASVFEGRQTEFSKELKSMEAIADGLFNAAAPWSHQAAAAQAATTPEGRRQVAAVTQLEMGKGVTVLDAKAEATAAGVASVSALGANFTPQGKEWSALYNSVMTDSWKGVFGSNSSLQEQWAKIVAGRAERFLAPVDASSYPAKVREAMLGLPGATLAVEGGAVVLKNVTAKDGATTQRMIAVTQQLNDVNRMLQVQNKLTGNTNRADKFVTDATVAPVRMEAGAPPVGAMLAPVKPITVAPPVEAPAKTSAAPAVQQVGELSLAPEMAAKYNQQKTLKGKVEVLIEAGIPESTIEAAIRGPVADALAGKREAPDSNKTSWWKQ